jgi:hypothetical protein
LFRHASGKPDHGLYVGDVSAQQVLIRVPRKRFLPPWRATFRGAAIPFEGGTLLIGKFDSNWSLYFLGYPILISVIVNIGFNIAGGLGAGRSGEYMLFFTAAVALSATLAWFDSSDRRDIAAALRGAIKGSFA